MGAQLLHLFGGEVIALGLGEQKLGGVDVSGGVEQKALRLGAVASRAAGLLVVVLERERQVVVDDVVDVALVDAHAKGVGGHHNGLAVVEEVVLVGLALGGGEARVVARGCHAVLAKHVADVLDRTAA